MITPIGRFAYGGVFGFGTGFGLDKAAQIFTEFAPVKDIPPTFAGLIGGAAIGLALAQADVVPRNTNSEQ